VKGVRYNKKALGFYTQKLRALKIKAWSFENKSLSL